MALSRTYWRIELSCCLAVWTGMSKVVAACFASVAVKPTPPCKSLPHHDSCLSWLMSYAQRGRFPCRGCAGWVDNPTSTWSRRLLSCLCRSVELLEEEIVSIDPLYASPLHASECEALRLEYKKLRAGGAPRPGYSGPPDPQHAKGRPVQPVPPFFQYDAPPELSHVYYNGMQVCVPPAAALASSPLVCAANCPGPNRTTTSAH